MSSSSRTKTVVRLVSGSVALLAGLAGLLRWTSPVAEWIAVASLMIGAWALVPSLGIARRAIGPRIPARLRSVAAAGWPYAAAAVVVGWATWPVLLGDVPFTQDHAHHYLQTSILTDDLIPRGHIFGWTERIGGGLPFGDVYGTGAYFATGLLRIVSFGTISLATSYAFGIFLVWAIGAWALVAWTRRLLDGLVSRPIVADLSAVAAAAFFVLDIGGDREGGWVYSMFHAVWPQLLGTGLLLWAVLAMVRLLERPTVRRIGVAVIVTGFAFWAHPMNVLNLAVIAPLLFIVAAFSTRESDATAEADVWWLVPAFGLAGIIGFGWASHMLAAGDDLMSFTAYGNDMQNYVTSLLGRGALFDNGLAIVGIAALAGGIVAARRGGILRLFTVAGLMLFVVLSSLDLFASTDLGISEGAPFLMCKRFVITAKPLLYALAGVGLAVGATAAIDARRTTTSPWVTALILIVAAPLVWSTARALPGLVRTPDSRILTVSDARMGQPLAEITKLLIREQGSAPGPRRVLVDYQRGDHGDYELFAVTQAEMGYLPNRNPPAHAYADLNTVSDMELATELGASHIITRSDRRFVGTVELANVPPFRLLRIKEKPRDGVWSPNSNALIQTTAWEPMRHEVSVSGSKEGESLIFGFPPYHKWHFYQDGRPLKAEEYRSGKAVLTKVSGYSDGTIVATYEDTTTEIVAFVFFLIVLMLALVALFFDRRLPVVPAPIGGRAVPVGAVSIAAIFAAVVVWAQVKGAEGLQERWAPGDGQRVLSVLHRTDPSWDYRPRPYCVRPISRNPRADCDDSVLVPRLKLAPPERTKIPACLNVTIPDNGYIELTFDVPPAATRLKGRFHGPHRSVKKFLKAGNVDESFQSARVDVALQKARGVTLRLENKALRSKQVCLELVAIGPE